MFKSCACHLLDKYGYMKLIGVLHCPTSVFFVFFLMKEFAADRAQFLPPWVLYFSACGERDRLLEELDFVWTSIFQVIFSVNEYGNHITWAFFYNIKHEKLSQNNVNKS